MKKVLLSSMIILVSLFLTACDNKKEMKEEVKTQKKSLVVGMELAYPPFEMSDKDGTPSGVSVDFAKALGAHLGREVIIENIAWDGLIPSLKIKILEILEQPEMVIDIKT